MIRILFTEKFLDSAARLPRNQQEKLSKLTEILEKNVFHPQLHTKALVGKLSGLYSFRITRDWRVIFQFINPKTIQLLRVAHRKDIYR
ncbi:type II toxin-antitoxin system RelE/ParE family toxin [Candidatus Giovannonibacteria bacterium]|nr:type II toxin-antitoxin system RelE/ParE family toxin [Candidatus Giovannonibacteria bacterium]